MNTNDMKNKRKAIVNLLAEMQHDLICRKV